MEGDRGAGDGRKGGGRCAGGRRRGRGKREKTGKITQHYEIFGNRKNVKKYRVGTGIKGYGKPEV